MKRRNFLSLIGAATTAPLIPTIGAASAPLYSRTAFSRAVMHARLRPHVSARGIAFRLKVSTTQAEGMIAEMTSKGLVRPISGGGGVHVRAFSNIVKPQAYGAGTAARNARADAATRRQADFIKSHRAKPTPLMAHLHQLCRARGLRLSPMALTPQAVLA
jgi:hypothetical protein